mgnify:CR=1 FL=1
MFKSWVIDNVRHLDSKVKFILYKLALDKYSYESVVVNLYCTIVCIKSKREGLILCDIYQPHIAQALLFSVSIYLQEEKIKCIYPFDKGGYRWR